MLDFVDIRISELLCSRLCHELASPVGAINNGIEMIEEFDDSMLPEALPLIGSSTKMAAARLAYYRMAYGAAGNQSIASFADLFALADAYFEEGRTVLSWPDPSGLPPLEDGWAKLILNLLPLAAETLLRGGDLTVSFDHAADTRIGVRASGEGPRISEDCRHALAPDVDIDTLTARNIHAYFVTRLAMRLGSKIEIDESASGHIAFTVRLH